MTVKRDGRAMAGGSCLEPPAWVETIMRGCHVETTLEVDRFTHCTVRDAGDLSLVTTTVRGADGLDPLSFQRQTVIAYRATAHALQKRHARYPIRFWNFIPDINKCVDISISRYMVFNAGRFAAFHEWYGESKSFGRHVATASGVGHCCSDLVIHCLSSSASGRAIENPRQISSYHYSSQFGPLPPAFARATAVQLSSVENLLLLVGGTASIRGERSVHHDDVVAQADETLHNLAAVVRADNAEIADDPCINHATDCMWLERFRWMRVYHPRLADRKIIAQILADRCPNVEQVEWRQASLCRPELLIEIEGVAQRPRIENTQPFVIHNTSRQRAALEA